MEARQIEKNYRMNLQGFGHILKYSKSFWKNSQKDESAHKNKKVLLMRAYELSIEDIYLTKMLNNFSVRNNHSFKNILNCRTNLGSHLNISPMRKNSAIIKNGEEKIQYAKFQNSKNGVQSQIEIVDVKQSHLTDEEIKSIVDIEYNSKVREWVYEPVDIEYKKELQGYQKFFRELPKNKDAEILVAKNNGKVVGFLALWKVGPYMEHVASIGISVDPSFWGKGVATKLISSAIELAKEKMIKRLEVETLIENTPMRRVVEKLGFKLESTRKNRVNKGGSYHDEVAYFMLL